MDCLFDVYDPPKAATDWKWRFSDYPDEKNGITVFSCFACGGGSTMGYKLAGCDVLGCVEIDPRMNELYACNHHPKFNFLMDLRDFNNLPDEEIPCELFDLDILDGSPPCTTFTMSGDREKSWGKKKKFKEGQAEQTLDDLSFVFIDTVERLKPRVVIMENVEGLILGEAFSYVQEIYMRFTEAGYFVHHWLLKGEAMGIPQARHRVFFVACRGDLHIDPREIDMSFNYAPIHFWQIRDDSPGHPIKMNTQQWKMLQIATSEHKSVGDVLVSCGERCRCFNDKIVWPGDIVPTFPAKGNLIDGERKERFSLLTACHAQTFPEDYDFLSRSYFYPLGMSVPPVMMKRIVTRLIEQGVFDYAKPV